MVTAFIIDPMHTAIDGAFGRRFEGLILVTGEGKLTSSQVAEADKRMKYFHLCLPYGFDRYVGKLATCRNFKTHVKRNILYYFLYPLFKEFLVMTILTISCFCNMGCCYWVHLIESQFLVPISLKLSKLSIAIL